MPRVKKVRIDNIIYKQDSEVGEILNEDYQQIKKWRTGQSCPSFKKTLDIEEKLKLHIECLFARNPSVEYLQKLKDKQILLLENLDNIIKTRREYDEQLRTKK